MSGIPAGEMTVEFSDVLLLINLAAIALIIMMVYAPEIELATQRLQKRLTAFVLSVRIKLMHSLHRPIRPIH